MAIETWELYREIDTEKDYDEAKAAGAICLVLLTEEFPGHPTYTSLGPDIQTIAEQYGEGEYLLISEGRARRKKIKKVTTVTYEEVGDE